MKYAFWIGLLFILVNVQGQENNLDWKKFPSSDTQKVVTGEHILTDTKIDPQQVHFDTPIPGSNTNAIDSKIVEQDIKYSEYCKEHPQIKGYTILLYSGSGANSRNKAREMLLKFQEKFPESTTHLAWKSPNYEVRIGDYRSKVDAQIDLEIIKSEFPTAFIKTGMIELPPLEKVILTPYEEESK